MPDPLPRRSRRQWHDDVERELERQAERAKELSKWVFRLVPEDRRAWHAGISCWQVRRALNDVSVGIEIVNPGHEWGYRAFPEAQIQTVLAPGPATPAEAGR